MIGDLQQRAFQLSVCAVAMVALAGCTSNKQNAGNTSAQQPQLAAAAQANAAKNVQATMGEPDTGVSSPAQRPGGAGLPSMAAVNGPMVLPRGTRVVVRLEQPLNSQSAAAQDRFTGTVAQTVTVDGRTAIPAGATADGEVMRAHQGSAVSRLKLTTVTIAGAPFQVQATSPAAGRTVTFRVAEPARLGASSGTGPGTTGQAPSR